MQWERATAEEIGALDRGRTVVVLPLGSVEQHGGHLPLGTDSLLAHRLCLAAAEATDGAEVAVLPPPWYGLSAHHMRFPGTATLSADTLMRVAGDIVDSVVAHGFAHVLIVNGHGGNGGIVDVLASTLGHRHYGTARIASLTYFQLARDAIAELRGSPSGGMGHAGEFETAMMLHVAPQLVRMDRATTRYPDPGSAYLTTDLLGSSKARTFLDFKDLSPTGVFGDPSYASPEKGARFFAAVSEELAAMRTTLDRILHAPTWRDFKESIYALHQLIFGATKNRFLTQIMDDIVADRRAVLFDGKDTDKPAPPAVRQQTHRELAAIVGAIAEKKAKRAEELISDHLMRTLATINIWQ